jgi:hypothetical protein
MTDRFRIAILQRRDSTSDPPTPLPDSGPDELDLPLRRFCYEQNRRVVIQVGAAELETELDPDVRAIWIHLPGVVARLAAGEPEELAFSERSFDVALVPQVDTMACVVERWGSRTSSQSFVCDRAEVVAELRRFLDELADLAVRGGYLTAAQRDQLMSGT